MPRSPLFALAAALLITAGPAWAAPEAGSPDRPRPSSAQLTESALAGDVEAALALAGRSMRGDGVEKDAAQALRWYRRAAELGDAAAAFQAGQMLDKGVGAPRDVAAATGLMRQAADKGLPAAQVAVGLRYRDGVGVAADSDLAFAWLTRAAARGDRDGQYHLGELHAAGLGTPVDHLEALRWFELAAEQGHARAIYMVGMLIDSGQVGIHDAMAALTWYERAAHLGVPEAQYSLGYMLLIGAVNVPANRVEAERWLRLAAEQGHGNAQATLGLTLVREGQYPEAYQWLSRAAMAGHVAPAFELAGLLEAGKGVTKDLDAAYFWYHVAATRGLPDAKARMGRMAGVLPQRRRDEAVKKAAAWMQDRPSVE